MNILILSWRGPGHPLAGGAEAVTHEHAKAWVKAGHSVTLFTSRHKGAKREEKLNGVQIIRRGNQVPGVHIATLFHILGNKYDLIVDQFHGIPFFTPLYTRTKKLGFIHETTKEVWSLNPWPKPFNLIPLTIGTTFESFVFLFYRRVPFMTVSESTKKDLVKWGIPKSNVTVIHNGVTSIRPESLSKNKAKTAMYLGALTKDKGIADAVKAFSEIASQDNSWQFWVAGKGESKEEASLEKLVQKLGIVDKIKFFGYVSEARKFELLARSHVLINPSIREGWGLVNIEANSVGTPVIAYEVAGVVDSVQDGVTGVLVDRGKYKELAKAATALVDNKNKYEKVRKNALIWSKKFSWKQSIKKSLELIESL